MALNRENILSLIGSRRYHSAILTTFSFDFYFFEMKVMKWLRSCGIRNVNVLIDGNYYDELMEQSCGEEMKLASAYSLYPINHKLIFHPKIWMLFGEKEGLLIIGSGNLTNSGNGANDEIWGAFHFDIRSSENAEVFSEAWTYIQQISSSIKGFTYEKTNKWIVDQSKWLNDLPKVNSFEFLNTSKADKVAFLYNKNGNTIWNQLSQLISKENVTEICAISPFYDKDGKAILALKELFPSANINVVIDETGSVPSSLPSLKGVSFYNWNDLGVNKEIYSKNENSVSRSKLHAKIIHFKTKSDKEYCLFGSANITPEGLGIPGSNFNIEVSLLVLSNNGGLLNELGIKLRNSKNLADFTVTNRPTIYETVISSNKHKIKLQSAEHAYEELYLYSEGDYNSSFLIVLYNRENIAVNSIKIDVFSEEIKIKPLVSLKDVYYLQFFDIDLKESISRKILLSDYELLARTHPNPKTEDIERFYNDCRNGELTKVLDLLPFALTDETEDGENVMFNAGSSQNAKREDKKGPEKLYDLSSYKVLEQNNFEKNLLHTSLTLRVLDVLKFARSKEYSTNTESELRIDEQEEELGNLKGIDEKEISIIRNIPLSTLKSEKRKLNSYFESLYERQQSLIYSKDKSKNYKPTLTDLTKYLIALELIFEFGGRSEKYVEQEREYVFNYLEIKGESPYYNDNVKGCCLNLIGDFLMLVKSGFKEYQFEYTIKKLNQLKYEALISSIVCILNIRWKEQEQPYLNTLLLNCLHYLGEKRSQEFKSQINELMENLNIKIEGLKHPTNDLLENLSWLKKKIIPSFYETIKNIEIKKFSSVTQQGMIIYKSPFGYCFVKNMTHKNELVLARPGFAWDEEKEDYQRHNNDTEYTPIILPTFINVEI